MLNKLLTPWAETVGENPWQTYPRPQLKRESYVNINGLWNFAVSQTDSQPEQYDQEILVPFCPESMLGGVEAGDFTGKWLFYKRSFTLRSGFQKDKVLLRIGAADQIAKVYVNQKAIGTHIGGYEAFSFDITDALQADNELVIAVFDDLKDKSLPYGKQTLTRGGMWYTPVSGIWQTVWMESVPETYVKSLRIENRGGTVTIDVGDEGISGKVTVAGLGEFALENGSVTITPENPNLWSPENPYLYHFTLETESDKVES